MCVPRLRFVSRTYIGGLNVTRKTFIEGGVACQFGRNTIKILCSRREHDHMSVILKRTVDARMTEGEKSEVALLVGAGDAIGAAVARRFAAAGYCVCVARRDAEKSRSVVQEIVAAGGAAHAVSADVRNEEAVQGLFARVEAELGPVEVC